MNSFLFIKFIQKDILWNGTVKQYIFFHSLPFCVFIKKSGAFDKEWFYQAEELLWNLSETIKRGLKGVFEWEVKGKRESCC